MLSSVDVYVLVIPSGRGVTPFFLFFFFLSLAQPLGGVVERHRGFGNMPVHINLADAPS